MKNYLKTMAAVGFGIAAYLIFLIVLGFLIGLMYRMFMIGFGVFT